MQNNHNHLYFAVFFVALTAILFWTGNVKSNLVFLNEELRMKNITRVLDELLIEAQAFSVYDADRWQEIYGKNSDVSLPIASLAKTLPLAVAFGELGGEKVITLSPRAIKEAGDFGLFVYEKWNTGDLIKFTMMSSANDGVYALSESMPEILVKVNEKAKKIGMNNFYFGSVTGLDLIDETTKKSKEATAFASAKDANMMAIYAWKLRPEIFGASAVQELELTSLSSFVHQVKNTNVILNKIPDVLFSKTGYTELAGGNLSVIFKNRRGETLAVTLLGSTFFGRFSDMEQIIGVLYNL